MKAKVLFAVALYTLACFAQPALSNDEITAALDKMTLEEKAKLVVGMGMRFPGAPGDNGPAIGRTEEQVPGAAGTTLSLPDLGIPSLVLADGPAGLRISPIRNNDNTTTYYATAFPIATLLACTWDTALVRQVGLAVGNEVLEYGVDIILMPALNLHRNPLCGRNFEYYSEDPLVSGSIAAAMVKGIQTKGVGTSIKHFAANNQETNRMNIDTIVSERALRELYLKGFEIAVKQANPWTVMSSYNKINGVYASESFDLLTAILRNDWGFQSFVMTDWFGGKDAAAQLAAGNDLLMPGRPEQAKAILDAVQAGKLDEEILDRNVERILRIVFKSPAKLNYSYSNKPDLAAHAQLARAVAAEGMVLLKNEDKTLPLTNSKNVALFGNASYELVVGGTGSGDVNEAYSISLEQGLTDAVFRLDDSLKMLYTNYLKETKANQPQPRNWFQPAPPIAEMPAPVEAIQRLAELFDVAIVTIGRNSGEFADRKVEDDFNLSEAEQNLIRTVSENFHAKNKKVIVVLNIGGVIETASWRNLADAILLAWQPGQEGGFPIADVLTGRVNPSGKLASTFPIKYEDVPSAKNFPGTPTEAPERVVYEEGVYVGYRYYTTFDVPVAYEFGYGLSYTDYKFGKIKLNSKKFKESITATIKVTNSGAVEGKAVVQLYLSAPAKSMDKPARELKAFAKTKLLMPGETQKVTFELSAQDLASFDTPRTAWVAEAGQYQIHIGSSSTKIHQTVSFKLAKEQLVGMLTKALAPQVEINELTSKK